MMGDISGELLIKPPGLSVDRFHGQEAEKINVIKKELFDFRNLVEIAWSKSTVKEELKGDSESGRFKALGQCAVTTRLLIDVLKETHPELNAVNVVGTVARPDGFTALRHSWIEITDEKGTLYIADVTGDQREGLGIHAPKVVFESPENLEKDGYRYMKEREDTDEIMKERGSYKRYEILKHRFERVRENRTFYHYLLDGDIFIIGPVSAGKTELANSLQNILRQKAIDVGKLFRTVAHVVLTEDDENAVKPDLAKVRKGDQEEIKRIIQALYKKTRLIEQGLDKTALEKNPSGGIDVLYNSNVINDILEKEDVATAVSVIAQNHKVRELVMRWVWKLAEKHESVIITGHTLKELNLANYKVIHLTVDPQIAYEREMNKKPGTYLDAEAAQKAVDLRNSMDSIAKTEEILDQSPNVFTLDTSHLTLSQLGVPTLRRIARRAQFEERMHDIQEKLGIGRDKFEWEVNPIIAIMRLPGEKLFGEGDNRIFSGDIFREIAEKYKVDGITEFDLAIQTMIHMTSYPVDEVWLGDALKINDIASLVRLGETKSAYEKLYQALVSGEMILNLDLVRKECEFQAERIKKIGHETFSELWRRDQADGNQQVHPFVKMGNTDYNPFRGVEEPHILVGGKKIKSQIDFERKILFVKEEKSGKTIVFKEVPSDISELYGKGFHYLHEPRKDEYKAYGAYVEGDPLPFAWVSYSPVGRDYKKEMLIYYGIEPHATLEMTRAWNAAWSPKNSMSVLFTFAHEMLRYEWDIAVAEKLIPTPLKAIITAINPNLGFQANAFNGIGLIPVGLKPAQFTFIYNEENKRWDYNTRRQAQRVLNVADLQELVNHPYFIANRIPLLPTNEMVLAFDPKIQKKLRINPIYQIPTSGYQAITPQQIPR